MAKPRRPSRQRHQLHDGASRTGSGDVPARARPRRTREVHGDLGRRPHRRAAPRVRGPHAGEVRRPRAARRRTRRRQRGVDLRRAGVPQRRVQRRRRSPGERVQLRADPLRRDAARAHGTSTPASHDMDLNGVYASLCFPSFLPGFAGQRLQLLTDDPELALATVRAWNDWLLEDWAGSVPGRMIPCSSRTSSIPSSRPTRCGATPSAGSRRSRSPRLPHMLGLPSLHIGPLGSDHAGMRGDRHGRVPAHRLVGHVADARPTTRRPTSSACCSSATPCSPPSTGCTRRSRCASRTSASACPRAASAGCRPPRPPRPRAQYHDDVRHVERHRPHAGRGVAAQLLVLRHRRPVGVRASATASASTTSCSSPTTRTATRPGPTPRA